MNINEKDWERLRDQVQETHTKVTELVTIMNGGPGSWAPCLDHSKAMSDHEGRIRYIEGRIYRAIGVVAVVSGLAALSATFNIIERLFL